MSSEEPLLDVARTVVAVATEMGEPVAVIGAMALARHGFVRATFDVDIASQMAISSLDPLAEELRKRGLDVVVRKPDDDDALAGCIDVRLAPYDDDADEPDAKVQIVNFPKTKRNPCARALGRAEVVDGFPFASFADFVALKLFAGGPRDIEDVRRLLEVRPDADRAAMREVCAANGLEAKLAAILEER